MYVALGVNMQGHKELLGLWLSETEGAKFWLSCLTDLKNRGLKGVFIACIDGLSGFAEAIHTTYPEAKVQLCVVHLVRAALEYVVDKDSDAVDHRPEEDLPGRDGPRSGAGPRGFCSSLERQISDHRQAVAVEVAGHRGHVRFPARDPQGDLHHQCHRIS